MRGSAPHMAKSPNSENAWLGREEEQPSPPEALESRVLLGFMGLRGLEPWPRDGLGGGSVADRSFLQWHGQSWRVQVAVPARLRAVIGCAVLYHPLHTDSLAVANREKHKHVHLLKKRIEEAVRTPAADPLTEEAIQWRESAGEDYTSTLLEQRYEELVRSQGQPTADAYVEIATGRAMPITTSLIEEWIAERQMKPRQILDYRRAVKKLLAHLPTATVEPWIRGPLVTTGLP